MPGQSISRRPREGRASRSSGAGEGCIPAFAGVNGGALLGCSRTFWHAQASPITAGHSEKCRRCPLSTPRRSAPTAEVITPSLFAAATKEGQLTWYTSADLQLAEKVGKIFEQEFFGIRVHAERAGGERIFSRVAQEYSSGLHVADAVSTGDAAQFLAWKRQEMLAPYVPEDVARHIPPEHRDPDGLYATVRSSLCVIAYNTELVARGAAPKSFADLLDPRWKGKIVKAHPSYSRTIMTSTNQMVRELGWPYLEKLAQQQVLQLQSATDTPKKIVLGERPIMADGNEFERFVAQGDGQADRGCLCRRRRAFDCSRRRCSPPRRIRMPRGYSRTIRSAPKDSLGGLRSLHTLVKD